MGARARFFFFLPTFSRAKGGIGYPDCHLARLEKYGTHLGTGKIISPGEFLGPAVERTTWGQDLPLDVVTIFGFVSRLAVDVVTVMAAAVCGVVLDDRQRLLDVWRHCCDAGGVFSAVNLWILW